MMMGQTKTKVAMWGVAVILVGGLLVFGWNQQAG